MKMERSMRWVLPLLVLMGSQLAIAKGWPDLSNPTSVGGGEKDAALVVAIEGYLKVPAVPGAIENGKDWYRFLTRGRGVPGTAITYLQDGEGTVEKLRQHAKAAATKVKPGGTLWVVFIGHGAPAADGKDGVLVGADAQQDPDSLYARSLAQKELLSLVSGGAQAKTVLIVDACFSGRTVDNKPLVAGLQPLIPVRSAKDEARNVLVFSAGNANQFAGPLRGAARPAFSYLLLGALQGWGDGNRDGSITAGEAVEFTRAAMAQTIKGRTQTPELARGDASLALAKATRVVKPDLEELALLPDVVVQPVSGGAPAKPVQLTAYVLCQRKLKNGKYKDIVDCTSARLHAGDRLKVAVEVDSAAHLYILNDNSTGQFSMLFPDPGIENVIPAKQKVFLPAEPDEWFEFDEVGGVTEHIRVLASARKLPEMESLRGIEVPPSTGALPAAAQRAHAFVAERRASDGSGTRGLKKASSKPVIVKVGNSPISTLPHVTASPDVSLIEVAVTHD